MLRRQAAPSSATGALTVGDYVVHLDHGIGIYRGIETITVGEQVLECAVVEYEGGDRLNVPLYRIDIGGTKNKYVGTSEANMLTNLHRVDQEEPCVVLLDEVEKIFVQGGGDNTGVVQTMLSQMLWWLQEHKSRVLTIMTTNNVKVIPPELYREGRIDEVLYFGGLIHDEAVPFVQHALSVYSLKGVTSEALKQAATKICADLFPGSATGVLSQAALSKAVQVFVKQNLKKGLAS